MDTKNLLHQLTRTEILPSNFMEYKLFLSSLFSAMKQRTKYGYHQFAEDLGFSRTNIMYQYMQGVRKLTAKTAKQISDTLDLKGVERRYYELMIEYCNTGKQPVRDNCLQKMLDIKSHKLNSEVDKNQLSFLSEWYHPVILEFISINGFKNDPYWIAEQITPKLRPEQVKKSLVLLEKLQLIEIKDDVISVTNNTVRTGHRIRGIALTSYHKNMLERAQEALIRTPGKLRNISAMTISVNEENFNKIRSMIHEFNEKIFTIANESQDPDSIYQVNIQLFPFILPPKKDEEQ